MSTRNAGSCCPPRGRGEAVTHWTATSCARAAALGASRTCRPKSPLTADLKTPLQNITLCCATSCCSGGLANISEGALSVTDQVPVNQQPCFLSFRNPNFSFLLLLFSLTSVIAGLTCRQLGLRAPFSHRSTASTMRGGLICRKVVCIIARVLWRNVS